MKNRKERFMADIEQAKRIRDQIHNLDLTVPEHQKIYENKLYEFMKVNEGVRPKIYKDTKGNTTVGIGFNMDSPSARVEWESVFQGCVSFDDVYHGRRELTDKEIQKLFMLAIERRRKEIRNVYGSTWSKLKANERMMIEDAYYVGAILTGQGTKFSGYMKDYVKTSEVEFLEKAIGEIKHNSNPDKPLDRKLPREKAIENEKQRKKGIQARRDAQAAMLSSHVCPLYSRPHDLPIPEGASMEVFLGKDI